MTDEDIKKVMTICARLHPIVKKHLVNLMDKEKPEVAISKAKAGNFTCSPPPKKD